MRTRLKRNEGERYDKDLRILFAGSGDIRSVVKTIADPPTTYTGSLTVTINDLDFSIVCRNVILLLIALVVTDPDEAAECMIHFWYSALLRKSDMDILQNRIRPRVQEACKPIVRADKHSTDIFETTMTFGQRSIKISMCKRGWLFVLAVLKTPGGITAEEAGNLRRAITLSTRRKDHLDRYLYFLPPAHRLAHLKFRDDGILLPFGASRDEFCILNPSLYSAREGWYLFPIADPLHGWHSKDVYSVSTGPATADKYGKLYLYLKGVFQSFHTRLSASPISFEMHRLEFRDLIDIMEKQSFDRIDVSNMSEGWHGLPQTLRLVGPLLRPINGNPKATIITLFIEAVDKKLTHSDVAHLNSPKSPIFKRLLKYIPLDPVSGTKWEFDPDLLKWGVGLWLVTRYDHIWDRYISELNTPRLMKDSRVKMKRNHPIVEKWPYALKLLPGQEGAQEEFERRMGDGLTGGERYVEWQRATDEEIRRLWTLR
ncbi:hypothetical protein BJX61DRAFT_542323 [Aspergillus egyptiacus]|nr:hypothetical protein BJX61DRAFT_542323 [Aspergillus egyptiacus]